jgi:8-oxo-dGTP diphosphatase
LSYTYKYPRPALTVDILLFQKINDDYSLLLIQRDNPPYEGSWALPGGFVDMDETLIIAAKRELFEETKIVVDDLKQFYTFDAIDRDPRHRTISVAFFKILENIETSPVAASDAREAKFFSINSLPNLAFDHNFIIKKAIKEILKKGY